MKVFGLAGWSGSGKTTLMIRLLPELIARGLTVSTVKHAHHVFDVDKPGKDSYRHREAGAHEVMVSSANRWALMHENRDTPEADLEELLAHMSPVDLVLVEGFKHEPHDKLEIYRAAVGKPLLADTDPRIRAIASDVGLPNAPVPVVDLDDVTVIADIVLRACGFEDAAA